MVVGKNNSAFSAKFSGLTAEDEDKKICPKMTKKYVFPLLHHPKSKHRQIRTGFTQVIYSTIRLRRKETSQRKTKEPLAKRSPGEPTPSSKKTKQDPASSGAILEPIWFPS